MKQTYLHAHASGDDSATWYDAAPNYVSRNGVHWLWKSCSELFMSHSQLLNGAVEVSYMMCACCW
jgi:hypothetical protein